MCMFPDINLKHMQTYQPVLNLQVQVYCKAAIHLSQGLRPNNCKVHLKSNNLYCKEDLMKPKVDLALLQ